MTAIQQPPTVDGEDAPVRVLARPTFRARAGSGLAAFLRTALKVVAVIAVLLGLWKLLTMVTGVETFLLPPPELVVEEMWANAGVIGKHALVTTQEVVVGFLIASVLGLVCAILMTASRMVARFVYPALVVSQAIPKVAIAPLLVVWLGFGQPTIITIVVIIAFFPVAVSGAGGLREVPRDLVMLGHSMGLHGARLFRKIMIPYALGAIFSGLKVGMTLALIGAVVGEFVTGQSGLGYYIQSTSAAFNVPQSFGGTITIVLLGLALFKLVEIAESLAMPWRREHSAFTASA